MKILVADDETVIRELIRDILEKEGYEVIEASDGEEALHIFSAEQGIDLLILDVMMPKYSGWEVLEEIRRHHQRIPVIILTALDDVRHEVYGLERGADDYIVKPFSYEILVARVGALMRKWTNGSVIRKGELTIHPDTCQVFEQDRPVSLNNKEYSLLLYLVQNENLVLSREQILSAVWGFDYMGTNRTVDTHIKMLRSKLSSMAGDIHTVRGRGYRFSLEGQE